MESPLTCSRVEGNRHEETGQGENEPGQEKSPDKDKCTGIQNSMSYTLTSVEKGPNHESLRPDSVARDDSRTMN